MGRFGLPEVGSWRGPQEDDFDEVEEKEEESDEEEEPPHPLPFVTSPSWGRTRFSLYPPKETYPQLQQRYYGHQVATVDDELSVLKPRQQLFPPLDQYWDSSTASASAMMEYSQEQPREFRDDDDIDGITQLLRATKLIHSPAKHVQVQNQVGQKLKILADAAAQEYQKLDLWKESYQKKRDQQHKEAFHALRSILKADHEAARTILHLEKQERKEAEDRVKEQQDEVKREQDAQEEVSRKEQEARDHIKREQQEKRDQLTQARAEVERKEAEKMSYITEAQGLVNKLVEIRAVVQPFDVNKAVSKRRLQMKKMCRGRLNTLAAEVGKVQSVAGELIAAITAEKQQDEQMQGQIQQGNPEVSPDMAKGELYCLDLLATSALVRIQAEGFNG
jgi:hypothetical protein